MRTPVCLVHRAIFFPISILYELVRAYICVCECLFGGHANRMKEKLSFIRFYTQWENVEMLGVIDLFRMEYIPLSGWNIYNCNCTCMKCMLFYMHFSTPHSTQALAWKMYRIALRLYWIWFLAHATYAMHYYYYYYCKIS